MKIGLRLKGAEDAAKINCHCKFLPESTAAAGHGLRPAVRERSVRHSSRSCRGFVIGILLPVVALLCLAGATSLHAQTTTATPVTPGTFSITVTTAGSAVVTPMNDQPEFRIPPPVMVRLLLLGILALLLFLVAILFSTPDSKWCVEPTRRRAMWLVLAGSYVLLPILLVLTANGCSGGSSASTTPPPTTQSTSAGTYTWTVIATANSKSQFTPLTLIVQ